MYLIVFAVILGILFLTLGTIKTFIFTIKETSVIRLDNGFSWFYGLLFINILVLIFIHLYKYYLYNYGLVGKIGIKGERGDEGDCPNNLN